MKLLRRIPVKYRLPILHTLLWTVAWFRSKRWRTSPGSPGPLLVTGYLSESSGIAQAGRLTIDALKKSGLPVLQHDIVECYRHYINGSGVFPVRDTGGVWLIHANAQECLMGMCSYPAEQWVSRYRIGYWAWETTQADKMWVWAAQFLHEIWVPSRFVYDALNKAFRAAGKPSLIEKVSIMPHPMGDIGAIVPDRARFGLEKSKLEFLCLFDVRSAAIRKNPWAALSAWIKAFPTPLHDVRLHLKIQHLEEDQATKQRLLNVIGGRDDIALFTERLDNDSMASFMGSFDGLVSLHRSEGFGLTLAEAMAQGVTVVATGWSGNVDFMSENNSYLVPYRLIAVHDPSGMYGRTFGREDTDQLWADADIEAAGLILRQVVSDGERLLKAERARVSIRDLNIPWTRQALQQMQFYPFVRKG